MLIDSSPLLLWISVDGTHRDYFNRSWLSFAGRELAASEGAGWLASVHPEEREASARANEAGLRTRKEFQLEYRLRRHDGEYRHMLDRCTPGYDVRGRFLAFVGDCFDITELRSAAAEAARWKARYEATNEELEAFTYSVSHDLCAPLRHLAGFTDLLRARLETPDAQVQRYLDNISGAAARMGEMLDKLLALSRVGRLEMHRVPIDLRGMIEELVAELGPTFDARAIDWRIGTLPVVRADPLLLRSALQDLLANAVKFTAGRTPALIELESRTHLREHEIVVRDNGAGFDMRYVDRLFGVFQRLHPSGEFEGTGIGLASVRRIITRHGGRVWAEGTPGAGAAFHITLPMEAGE